MNRLFWLVAGFAPLAATEAAAQSGTLAYASTGTYVGGREQAPQAVDGSRSLTSATSSSASVTGTFGSASGYADLRTGEVKATAQSSAGSTYGTSRGEAELRDTVTFNVAGANSDTLTRIGITYSFHGLAERSPGMVYAAIGGFTVGGAGGFFYGNSNADDCIGSYKATWGSGDCASWSFGPAYTVTQPDAHSLFVSGTVEFRGKSYTYPVSAYIKLLTTGEAMLDFSNTARLGFVLPENVTFTSASGTFLSAAAPVGAVPEPGTWLMMLMGFGAVGFAVRGNRTRASLLKQVA